MEDVLVVESPVGRVVGEESAGTKLADHPDQLSAEFQGILKLPVRLAKENHLFGPHDPGGGPLLAFALQGQGVAADLVHAALAFARSQGLRVRPSCSYVAAYMRRHPETLDLLEGQEGDR